MKTIFGTKNIPTIQKDLKECGIPPHLCLQEAASRMIKPINSFVLAKEEKDGFIQIVGNLKTHFYYVSSLRKRISKDKKLKGMKSHAYHVMMQEILLLCMKNLMEKGCRQTIIRLSYVFKKLCAKVMDPTTMGDLKQDVASTLVLLEWVFPPFFFDVMTHLLVHLVEELELCGLVHTRWMYPTERYLKTLKRFVRNKARPEGSMVKGYALEEALGFCT